MPMQLSAKTVSLAGFLFCFGLLAGAFALEYGLNLVPCPLCMLQRYIFGLLGILFFISLFCKSPRALRWQFGCMTLVSILGITVSGRQVYLQHAPYDPAGACGPDLDYMLRHIPFRETLKLLYDGSGDCARVQWEFLGMSLPGWALSAFILLAAVTFAFAWKSRSPS